VGAAINLIRSGFKTTSAHHNAKTHLQTSCHPWKNYDITTFISTIIPNIYMLTDSYMLLKQAWCLADPLMMLIFNPTKRWIVDI